MEQTDSMASTMSTQASDEPWLLPPASIILGSRLGEGISAEVFVGTVNGDKVAVKRMKGGFSQMSKRSRMTIQRELEIFEHLSHPNIVRMLGVSMGVELDIVMELCHGSTYDLLHEAPEVEISWRQRMAMLQGTVQAMSYLHGLEPVIIHRDLKSLNVLLDRPVTNQHCIPQVKLADFGLARVKETAFKFMTTQVGTYTWMAPELLRAAASYDEKVDVYAFAIFCYEVFCRAIPFEDQEAAVVAERVKAGDRPDLSLLPPESPVMVTSLLKLCWHQDPSARPAFAKLETYLGMLGQELGLGATDERQFRSC